MHKCVTGIAVCVLAALPLAAVFGERTPLIDSALSREEALAYVDPDCPTVIIENQALITVTYYSFDGRLHQGQMLIDHRLVEDIQQVFGLARALRVPIQSVIPLADKRLVKDGRWSDERSMEENNSSGFNYRTTPGGGKLSLHAYGYALDINPRLNPYIKGKTVLPGSAVYDPSVAGTLTADHPIVRAFLIRGWSWGGQWRSLKDYQHFEKEP